MNKITILGGGTAGLISALMLKESMHHATIQVIESSKIGIIGVGEGSTEHWDTFLKYIEIDPADLIVNTGATYKLGIRFENWNGDGKHYWHAIGREFGALDEKTGLYPYAYKCVAENTDSDSTVWQEVLDNTVTPPFTQVSNQYHFDTNKLNNYFHKLASERGILFFDDEIDDVVLDDDGFVSSLIGKKQTYDGDLFVDCSGFNRVISSKLGAKWIDCSDKLPMNSAIAFPTPREEEIPQYTNSKAMSSGWMWRIPTQDRFGNGYVYCDKFISDEDAEKELRAEFDYDITIGKKIKFSAGYVDRHWIKNCVSVGLAGMFVEPLEASSIGSSIQQMFGLINTIHTWTRETTTSVDRYNSDFRKVAENIIDFIQLHYITKRDDSEFWRWVKDGLVLTDFNKQNLENWKTNFPSHCIFNEHSNMFKNINFIQVLHGLELFDHTAFKKMYKERYPQFEDFCANLNLEANNTLHDGAVSHREAIDSVLRGYKTDYITIGDIGFARKN